ncbi:AbrB/MazE/SpoVT family DNA-binding domain-containing protein [Rhizobium tumorigenes]|uniref:AbrB/MazE/SpoVT family DNA-binding domain-containing protein n=1 Tax=Rhizobium tumorigenes TaxID=2041385 RepID=A0AAF1KJU9_9HYPH|nr:AbrB/MazE/SpoVT family DNA-binding domain-containing protein [Rhizobium tumorigenes]WFR97203.1 AbrB/MazE/SpoVT family DNA-binding domain-containing protein [Rhizobium tumorigenes]
MATAIMSKTGAVILPKEVRDAHGLEPGAEFEIIDGGGEITLRLVDRTPETSTHRVKVADFLAQRVHYNGPPLTEDLSRQAIDKVAIDDWKRLERQWNGDKGD